MTEHKFTDEEVIRALERCVEGTSEACHICSFGINPPYPVCKTMVEKHALDLIKRQKTEIERLDTIVNPKEHGVSFFMMINEAKERTKAHNRQLKAEAVKEFADRLREGRVSNDPVVIAVNTELKMMEEEK